MRGSMHPSHSTVHSTAQAMPEASFTRMQVNTMEDMTRMMTALMGGMRSGGIVVGGGGGGGHRRVNYGRHGPSAGDMYENMLELDRNNVKRAVPETARRKLPQRITSGADAKQECQVCKEPFGAGVKAIEL